MKNFKVSFNRKVRDKRQGSIIETVFRLQPEFASVKAETFGKARAKIRQKHGYDIQNIVVEVA